MEPAPKPALRDGAASRDGRLSGCRDITLMGPAEFIRKAAQAKLGPAYFLRGSDAFLQEECRTALVASIPPDARPWCLAEVEFEPGRLARGLEGASQMPMLGVHSLLVFSDPEDFGHAAEEDHGALEAYLERAVILLRGVAEIFGVGEDEQAMPAEHRHLAGPFEPASQAPRLEFYLRQAPRPGVRGNRGDQRRPALLLKKSVGAAQE